MRMQKGFSLIEVLVCTGLMAMIGLVMANYFQNNIKAQQTVGKGYEKDSLHEEIRRFLSNEKDCSATFTGINPTTTFDVPKLVIAPNVDSKYLKNAILGGGHIKITAMTWGNFVASSTPNSGIAILSINYQKVGESIGPADYKAKDIEINVVTDPSAGNTLVTCQSRSAMSDGLWTRSVVADSNPSRLNIYYNAGSVGVGTDRPHSGALAHFHNDANQGYMYISGISDLTPSSTYSALYLGDQNASKLGSSSNQWVMAYKNTAAAGETPQSLIFAQQQRPAGSWNQNAGYAAMVLTPPNLSTSPPTQGTMSVGTGAPNTEKIAHFHNSTTQGSVMVSGASDTNKTWASFVLGDGSASTKASPSNQWAMAYKKTGVANETPESLLFTYQTRAAGGWTLGGGGSTPLTITPPNTNGVAKGGIGIFIEQPTAELHVDGKSLITKLATFNDNVIIDKDLTVRNITASGTITSTGAISSGSTITAASDQRLKKDIQPITFSLLPVIEKLRPVSYLRKDESLNDQGREIGFIAQEVQKLFPELVRESGSSHMLGINYGQLTAVLTKGVQELQQQNLQCSADNKNLKKQLAAMEDRLQKIEKALSRH